MDLAGTSWSCENDTLTFTFEAIGRSVLKYGAPIWTATLSDTNWLKLRSTQNVALRTITGSVDVTPIDHLHVENIIIRVSAISFELSPP